ncbi:inositol polyphosphate 5-phosphatase K-like [Haliotis rufescens]|uniref:inositol polyphosphate 5-phosphatase K-like n=1 Tax=Haliotis rufescens TaxID=6454 RepID=UPI001EB032DB|nr:inositol polyphosphate 5-phosphatase K-like [Haliotis rufescens]
MAKKLPCKQMRLYLCTWNVGGSKPAVDFTDVLDLENSKHPDLYCIGLQEIDVHDLSLEEHPWSKALTTCLGSRGYVKLKGRRMRGVMTIVFARRALLSHITSIEAEATKTGLGGWWGNKGGASVRLDLFGMNLIIVNAHLAAHRENIQERIIDFDSILDSQKFKDEDVDNILDHDYVFWMGDLNFRLEDLTYEGAIRHIEKGNLTKLLTYDQLIQCKEERLIYEDFEEGRITFPPTYKFDKGTDTYDTSKKKRVPAWCDRILWHAHHESYGTVSLEVKQLDYRSHPQYKISDHKPVTSQVDIQVFGKPPPSPVKFQMIIKWYISQGSTVTYTMKAKSFSTDWIGLYKADFKSFSEYVSYIYAEEGAEERGDRGVIMEFPASKLRVAAGQYVLCYLTKNYSLQGITNEFMISP